MTVDEKKWQRCAQTGRIHGYLLQTLSSDEVAEIESHIAGCMDCLHEFEMLQPVVASFVSWPLSALPSRLWWRLARRIAANGVPTPVQRLPPTFNDPDWKEVAPGIACRLLSTDFERHRVSMLVRLSPGASYPSHVHAGVEELYLLDGELMIDDRLLYPGDYNRAEPGTTDLRVWSKTGCTCVLITSTSDALR